MADSVVNITAGAGTGIDTRTNAAGEHRQVVTIGNNGELVADLTDPSTLTGALSGGTNGVSLNVNTNSIQKASYIAHNNIATGVLTANTAKAFQSIHHPIASTKTVRIRSITVGLLNATATAGNVFVEIRRGTTGTTAGSILTAQPLQPGTAAAEAVSTNNTTLAITAATILHTYHFGNIAASGSTPSQTIFSWLDSSETIPLTLRAGNLDSISLWITASAAINITPYSTITFTEE